MNPYTGTSSLATVCPETRLRSGSALLKPRAGLQSLHGARWICVPPRQCRADNELFCCALLADSGADAGRFCAYQRRPSASCMAAGRCPATKCGPAAALAALCCLCQHSHIHGRKYYPATHLLACLCVTLKPPLPRWVLPTDKHAVCAVQKLAAKNKADKEKVGKAQVKAAAGHH